MHLLIACAVFLVFVLLFDLPRVRANGLLFVLQDYVGQVSRRMTFKRVIYTIGVLLFAMAAWQAVGFDWAFIAIGGDVMLYLEIVSTIYFLAVRGHIYQIARFVRAAIDLRRRTIWVRLPRSGDRKEQRRDSSKNGEGDEEARPAMIAVFAFS